MNQAELCELRMVYAECTAAVPGDADVPRAYGQALLAAGRVLEALEPLMRVCRLEPGNWAACFDLGLALTRADRRPQALVAFSEAKRRAPFDDSRDSGWRRASIVLNVARCQLGLGEIERARATIAELSKDVALEQYPGLQATASCLEGRIAEHVGQREVAQAAYRAALAVAPRTAAAYAGLARVGGLDDSEAVAELLNEAELSTEDQCMLRFALAQTLDRRGEHRAAFVQAELANQMQPVRFDSVAFELDAERLAAAVAAGAGDPSRRAAQDSSLGSGVVFTVGQPRSGTTLVEAMLAQHPDIAALGEHPELGRISRERIQRFGSRTQAWRELSAVDAVQLGERYLASVPESARSARRVVDKTPGNLLDLATVARALPAALVVHCVRDERDACLSAWFQHFEFGAVVHAYDLEHLAAHARVSQRLAACWRKELPLAWFELRYEQLVRDPEPVLRALLAFLGLEWHPACLDFHRSSRAVMTASTSQVREPLHARSVGRWKAYAPWLGPVAELRPS